MQNIRNTIDPFDRYQMPSLETRHKHQGQYNHTYITNINKIARAILVNPAVITKYFSSTLNTQCKLCGGELTLKGNFSIDVLKTTLGKFIKEYILCDRCDLPELTYTPQKKHLKIKCQACGYSKSGNDRIYKAICIENMKTMQDKK